MCSGPDGGASGGRRQQHQEFPALQDPDRQAHQGHGAVGEGHGTVEAEVRGERRTTNSILEEYSFPFGEIQIPSLTNPATVALGNPLWQLPSSGEQRPGEEDEQGLDGAGERGGGPEEEARHHDQAQQDPQQGEVRAAREVQDLGELRVQDVFIQG